ncbi:hypothetical protein C8R43DRAFT_373719 [Mycena crocata]|nr:hypothetical protein C8R43DRAFT_373719 [Mycena crocata]
MERDNGRGTLRPKSISPECWDMRTGRRVWTWTQPLAWVDYVAFDFWDASRMLVAFMSEGNEFFEHGGVGSTFVLEVDLDTGDAREHLSFDPTGLSINSRLQLADDLLACKGTAYSDKFHEGFPVVLLVNWRTAEYILLDFFSSDDEEREAYSLEEHDKDAAMALGPGFLLLA